MRELYEYRIERIETRLDGFEKKLDQLDERFEYVVSEIKAFKGFITGLSIVGACLMTFAPMLIKVLVGA